MKSKNEFYLTQIIKIFAYESIDLSAKGYLRILESKHDLSIDEILALLKPRDYDIDISRIQLDRIREKLDECHILPIIFRQKKTRN